MSYPARPWSVEPVLFKRGLPRGCRRHLSGGYNFARAMQQRTANERFAQFFRSEQLSKKPSG